MTSSRDREDRDVTFDPYAVEKKFMRNAIDLAQVASERGEVPVGAVVVYRGAIIGRGGNAPIGDADPTAHAEILALRDAAQWLGNYRLVDADLYCTLEPCLMCFGAALHARVRSVTYGASDPRVGAAALIGELGSRTGALNHALVIEGGILARECAGLLQEFFAVRRSETSCKR